MMDCNEGNFLEKLMPSLRKGGPKPDACPAPESLCAFAEGVLDAEDRRGVELHLASCPRCSELADRLMRFEDAAVPDAEWRGVEKRLGNWMDSFLQAETAKAARTPASHGASPRWRFWHLVPRPAVLYGLAAAAILGLGGLTFSLLLLRRLPAPSTVASITKPQAGPRTEFPRQAPQGRRAPPATLPREQSTSPAATESPVLRSYSGKSTGNEIRPTPNQVRTVEQNQPAKAADSDIIPEAAGPLEPAVVLLPVPPRADGNRTTQTAEAVPAPPRNDSGAQAARALAQITPPSPTEPPAAPRMADSCPFCLVLKSRPARTRATASQASPLTPKAAGPTEPAAVPLPLPPPADSNRTSQTANALPPPPLNDSAEIPKLAREPEAPATSRVTPLPVRPKESDPVVSRIPEQAGLYYLTGNELVRLDLRSLAAAKTAGLFSHRTSAGINRVKTNAYLIGPSAKTRVRETSPVFYLRLPEGTSIDEVALVSLNVKQDRRELELSAKSGFLGSKQGIRMEVMKPFESQEVAAGVYKIGSMLPKGEYLFYLIGTADQVRGVQGKGYDFGSEGPGTRPLAQMARASTAPGPPPPTPALVDLPPSPALGTVYVSAQNAANRLLLNSDGSFLLQENGQAYNGTYLVNGSTLKIHITQLDKDVDIAIDGARLVVNGDETWVQPGRQASTPSGRTTVNKGDTVDQVKAKLGPPEKVVSLGSKLIYLYQHRKVTFADGKVVDVE